MKKISLLLAGLFAVFSVNAQVKEPTPAAIKIPFSESLQAVVVTTKKAEDTNGTARLFERNSLRDAWKPVGQPFPVVVGRSGLGWAVDSAPEKIKDFKKEGDGRSPAGLFPLTYAFGSSEKPEALDYPYTKLVSSTECVDDPQSGHYNKIVDRFKVGNFDWKSSEKMLEVGEEYGLGVFVAYNSYPVRSGDGSCIFLHVWKDENTPTSGCTAMSRRDVERIVSWLDTSRNPYLVQLTERDYSSLRRKWNLPRIR